MRETVHSAALAQVALAPAAHTATANGVTVDKHASNSAARSVGFVVHAGTVTDGTHTFTVEDSDDGTTWGAAADHHVVGNLPALSSANDGGVFQFEYTGHKRYVRVVVTVATATTGGLYGATALLLGNRRRPVN